MEEDFLEEIMADYARQDPEFPKRVEAGVQRLERLRGLTISRKANKLSQATIAAYMGTTRSFVSHFELGDEYVTDEVLDRYAAALAQAQGGQGLRATS